VPAGAQFLEFLASRGDLEALGFEGETELVADLVLKFGDLLALEFDDLLAILADDVIVVRVLGVVRVVKLAVFAEIHFPDQSALGQQRKGAINRRARYGAIPLSRPFQKLFGGEMLVRAEDRFDDRLALGRHPQALSGEEFHEPLLRGRFRVRQHKTSIFRAPNKSTRRALPFHLSLRAGNCYNLPMSPELRIGFLGAGKMATALARGFVKAGLIGADAILASDPVELARNDFHKSVNARTTESNPEVLKFATVIVLAVKPEQVDAVLTEARGASGKQHLFISIAAGVPLAKLQNGLGTEARIIRVMPNTPALVGASATAFALGSAAQPQDAELARKLFSSVGLAYQVKEPLLDAVTGLSGSGPAYVYLMIEALSDGGVACGLPRDVATKLAAQTVFGAARMVLETNLHPGVLKDMVTSPGGTTIEGIYELERAGVRGAFMTAVRAATEKSKRLGSV